MQKTIYLIVTICLVALILICLGAWIYSRDMFFLGIGVLLVMVLVLVILELKKAMKNPFS